MGEIVKIRGKAMYARVFEHNRDMEGYEGNARPYNGMYKIRVGVPYGGPEFKGFMGWNRMYEPKIGGESKGYELDRGAVEGLAYFEVKRKHEQRRKSDNSVIDAWSYAPKIINEDGTPFDTDKLIGNGSDVTVKLDVERDKNNPKIYYVRLEAIMVHELVEVTQEEVDAAKDNAAAKPDAKGITEDDIPF